MNYQVPHQDFRKFTLSHLTANSTFSLLVISPSSSAAAVAAWWHVAKTCLGISIRFESQDYKCVCVCGYALVRGGIPELYTLSLVRGPIPFIQEFGGMWPNTKYSCVQRWSTDLTTIRFIKLCCVEYNNSAADETDDDYGWIMAYLSSRREQPREE